MHLQHINKKCNQLNELRYANYSSDIKRFHFQISTPQTNFLASYWISMHKIFNVKIIGLDIELF